MHPDHPKLSAAPKTTEGQTLLSVASHEPQLVVQGFLPTAMPSRNVPGLEENQGIRDLGYQVVCGMEMRDPERHPGVPKRVISV